MLSVPRVGYQGAPIARPGLCGIKWYQICDYGLGSDAVAMLEAYNYEFGCDASAREEALDAWWLQTTEIGEDMLHFPPTPDSFD